MSECMRCVDSLEELEALNRELRSQLERMERLKKSLPDDGGRKTENRRQSTEANNGIASHHENQKIKK